MPFDDPILGGNVLIRDAIRSPNYLSGTSGWSINADGSAEFTNVQIVVTGNNGLQIIRTSDGALVGSIDSDGNASFNSVNIASNQLYVNGALIGDMLNLLPRGIIARGTLPANDSGTGERAALELAFTADATRLYEMNVQAPMSSDVNDDTFKIFLRDGGASAPTTSSPLLADRNMAGGQSLYYGVHAAPGFYVSGFTAGQHRVLLSYSSAAGNTATIYSGANLLIKDIGPLIPDTGVSRIAGGGGGSPVQTYTNSFGAYWSGTYSAGGAYISQYGNEAIQGQSPGFGQNIKSMIGWFSGTLGAYLSGATVLSCSVTLYANHWYNNNGGTAVIGTHNAGDTRPGSFSGTTNRLQRAGWPKPGKITVDLGAAIGQEIANGTTSGITLGPGITTGNVYYGRFDGVGFGNPPVLNFTYER